MEQTARYSFQNLVVRNEQRQRSGNKRRFLSTFLATTEKGRKSLSTPSMPFWRGSAGVLSAVEGPY